MKPEGDRIECPHCNLVIEMRGGSREERAEFLRRRIIAHFRAEHPLIPLRPEDETLVTGSF